MHPKLLLWLALLAAVSSAWAQLDIGGNRQSDVWELLYETGGLDPDADADGDFSSNEDESIAGTDPHDAQSRPDGTLDGGQLRWSGQPGKRYLIEHTLSLSSPFTSVAAFDGIAGAQDYWIQQAASLGFFRVRVEDLDTDGDGLFDWEEHVIGYDPSRSNTLRLPDDDFTRASQAMDPNLDNTVSASVVDGSSSEQWPEPIVFAVRRTGNLHPINVDLAFGGSANASDYQPVPTRVSLGPGENEVFVTVSPLADAVQEGAETVTLTVLNGVGYSVGSPAQVVGTIEDTDPDGRPSAKEAARFLTQTTFGPTLTLIEDVQQLGFADWLEAQFAAPLGLHQPVLAAISFDDTNGDGSPDGPYAHHKMIAWWENAMRGPDPLRQRLAFALSEILVISDSSDELAGLPAAMLNYYDMLLTHAFGNFRDILRGATFHPCMGVYLSHRGNRPPDPVLGRFPDENYAREILQLFSIGLWELNPDGTRHLDASGNPIPTYTNDDITNLARVFTGMSWGTGDTDNYWQFFWPDTPGGHANSFLEPMKVWNGPFQIWDTEIGGFTNAYHHDQGSKTFLGQTLPAFSPDSTYEPDYAQADIEAALDIIFAHPNVGPFIGKQLIQRMVTSNPSPAYVARVAEAFDGAGPHNPDGIRGDMKAVIRAIFLDPESRSLSPATNPAYGKLRVPYLRLVSLYRALEFEPPPGDYYEVFWVGGSYGMQPMASPSVFNFYPPDHQPPGEIKDLGLVGPEFQITNAVTAISLPNDLYGTIEWWVDLNLDPLTALADEPDALLSRLDLLFCHGQMGPEVHETIRFALDRTDTQYLTDEQRARLALYLTVTSPDCSVLR